ncbi:hypothetical protein NKH77_19725 [Streptomyces sp. M19]
MSDTGQGWARRLTAYCWRYRRGVLLALGASLAGMAVTALVPLVPKLIIDDVIVDHDRPLAPGPRSSSSRRSWCTGWRTCGASTEGGSPSTSNTTCARRCSRRSRGSTASARTS